MWAVEWGIQAAGRRMFGGWVGFGGWAAGRRMFGGWVEREGGGGAVWAEGGGMGWGKRRGRASGARVRSGVAEAAAAVTDLDTSASILNQHDRVDIDGVRRPGRREGGRGGDGSMR